MYFVGSKCAGDFPYSIKYPLDNAYGMMLLSKLLLTESAVNFLVELKYRIRTPCRQVRNILYITAKLNWFI